MSNEEPRTNSTKFETETLDVSWTGGEAGISHALVRNACRTVATAFLRGQGPWGFGLFKSFHCVAEEPKAVPSSWHLQLAWLDDALEVTLSYAPQASRQTSSEPSSQAPSKHAQSWAVRLPRTRSTAATLAADPLYAKELSGAIYAQLPMVIAAAPGTPQPWQKPATDAGSGLNQLAPQSVTFAALHLVPARPPLSSLFFKAEAAQPGEPIFGLAAGWPAGASTKLRDLAWERDQSTEKQVQDHEAAYAAAAEEEAEAANEAAEEAAENLAAKAAAFIPTTLFGARYGRELVTGQNAELPLTSMYDVFAEFTDGAGQAINLSFDAVPKVNQVTDGESLYFSWNRANISYAFFLATRILRRSCLFSLAPKAGYWTADAKLPAPGPGGTETVAHFSTTRAVSLGAIGTAQMYLNRWNFTTWLEDDWALKGLGSHKATVAELRFGQDVYYKLPTFHLFPESMRLSLLIYVQEENLRFSLPEAGVQAMGNINVESTYGGLGLSFVW